MSLVIAKLVQKKKNSKKQEEERKAKTQKIRTGNMLLRLTKWITIFLNLTFILPIVKTG